MLWLCSLCKDKAPTACSLEMLRGRGSCHLMDAVLLGDHAVCHFSAQLKQLTATSCYKYVSFFFPSGVSWFLYSLQKRALRKKPVDRQQPGGNGWT